MAAVEANENLGELIEVYGRVGTGNHSVQSVPVTVIPIGHYEWTIDGPRNAGKGFNTTIEDVMYASPHECFRTTVQCDIGNTRGVVYDYLDGECPGERTVRDSYMPLKRRQ